MRYSSSSALMLVALSISEAVAGPAHAHLHRHAHEKKAAKPVNWDSLDWDSFNIDWVSAYWAGQASKTATATTAAATSTSAASETTVAAAAVATKAASSSSASSASASSNSNSIADTIDDLSDTISSTVKSLFSAIEAASNDRTSFGTKVVGDGTTGDFARGNFGSPYGSNIIKVDSTSGYDFTTKFVNTQSKAIVVNVWNKIGPDMRTFSGSAMAPSNTSLTFMLAPGASQIVAFDDESMVAWAEVCSKKATSGAYATTWGEGNFVSTGSGYDMSAIMNADGNKYNMTLTSEEAPQCTSDPTQNYWLTDTQPIGDSDGSCYIAQSHAHLTCLMGGVM